MSGKGPHIRTVGGTQEMLSKKWQSTVPWFNAAGGARASLYPTTLILPLSPWALRSSTTHVNAQLTSQS